MRKFILNILDFFYPICRPFINKQTYYYAACGGLNMGLDLVLYYLSYHYIFHERIFQLTSTIAFEPYIAAFLFAFIITFPTGFILSRYIVWPQSKVRGRIQLFRYLLLVLTNIFLNYALLKIFVETFYIYPSVSKLLTIIIIVTFSYLTQKYFTFKVK